MFLILAFIILGTLFNRIRGGWLLPRFHDMTNNLAFGLTAGLLLQSSWVGALAALGMGLGSSLGWGRYIGALGGWETRPLHEVSAIDVLIAWLKPKRLNIAYDIPVYINRRQLMLWGAAGLGLRGFLWGAALLLPLLFLAVRGDTALSFEVMAAFTLWAGLAMPLCYWLAITGAKALGRQSWQGDGWEAGEFAYGAALWGGWATLALAI